MSTDRMRRRFIAALSKWGSTNRRRFPWRETAGLLQLSQVRAVDIFHHKMMQAARNTEFVECDNVGVT